MAFADAPSGRRRQIITIPGDEAQLAPHGNDPRVTLGALSHGAALVGGEGEPGHELIELGDGAEFEPLALLLGRDGGGHDGPGEAELGGLLQPLVGMSDSADGAGEAHLAEIDCVLEDSAAGKGGEQRRCGGEIYGGLGEPQTAGNVEIDVVAAKADPAAGLEHRQQHGEPVGVPADHGAAWGAE